jgi:hypothetical protein
MHVGRGSVVDEEAVAHALEENRLGACAADVFAMEDWALPGHPTGIPARLLHHPRTLFTPASRLGGHRHPSGDVAYRRTTSPAGSRRPATRPRRERPTFPLAGGAVLAVLARLLPKRLAAPDRDPGNPAGLAPPPSQEELDLSERPRLARPCRPRCVRWWSGRPGKNPVTSMPGSRLSVPGSRQRSQGWPLSPVASAGPAVHPRPHRRLDEQRPTASVSGHDIRVRRRALTLQPGRVTSRAFPHPGCSAERSALPHRARHARSCPGGWAALPSG